MERRMTYEPLVTLYRDDYNINYYVELTKYRIVVLEELNDSGEMHPVVDFYRFANPILSIFAYNITNSLMLRISGLYQLTETQRINDEEKIFRSLQKFFANI